jgi:hypothetical protein
METKETSEKLSFTMKKKPAIKKTTAQKLASVTRRFLSRLSRPKKVQPDTGNTKESVKPKSKQVTRSKRISISDADSVVSAASSTIQRFMHNTSQKRRLVYLKMVCSDTGFCMAFDTVNRKKINHIFDRFVTTKFMISPIKQIGKTSKNGFVKEIRYSHDDYTASAVLKSSKRVSADNLLYEYLVGQFINEQCSLFPCFIETYGLFYYKDADHWDLFSKKRKIDAEKFADALELHSSSVEGKIDFAKACQHSKHIAILTQFIHGATSLNFYIDNGSLDYTAYQMVYQLPYILYQVYFPLSMLADNFTHYDLHSNNIVLYRPAKGKYIEYMYHLSDGKILTFKTPYLVKIIDYGRSFFKYRTAGKKGSLEIYDDICKEAECEYLEQNYKTGKTEKYSCGKKYGFSWLAKLKNPNLSTHYIQSSVANMSHDLRMLYITRHTLLEKGAHAFNLANRSTTEKAASTLIHEFIDKVNYEAGEKIDDISYGTKALPTSGLPSRINNVHDAERGLRELIEHPVLLKCNDFKYYNLENRLGILHIYTDGTQMKFER